MNDANSNLDSADGSLPIESASNQLGKNEKFSTTRWTMIVEAGLASDARSHPAMEDLCRIYWYPLYAHVRRRGYSKEDAEDLTQSFFTRLLEKNPLSRLSPEKGRFRSFLLVALKHFLANEWDKSHAQKRGGEISIVPIVSQDAEARYQTDPADHLSPDKLFDRAWAMTLLERALSRLEGMNAHNPYFQAIKPSLSKDRGDLNYADLAANLGISQGAVRVAIHRLRKQYRDTLKAEIADTLADPNQLEEELQALYLSFTE
jgi:RNA polymerase sigma factor (sigma-70 family)